MLLVEMVRAHRAADWIDFSVEQWLGALFVLTMYCLILSALTLTYRRLIDLLIPSRRGGAQRPLLAAFLSVASLTLAVYLLTLDAVGSRSIATYGALVIIGALVALATTCVAVLSLHVSLRSLSAIWVGVFLSGFSALRASNLMLFAYPERIPNATRVTCVWFILACVVCAAFLILSRRARPSLIACAIIIAVPQVFYFAIPTLNMIRKDSIGSNVILVTCERSTDDVEGKSALLTDFSGRGAAFTRCASMTSKPAEMLSVVMTSSTTGSQTIVEGNPTEDRQSSVITVVETLRGAGYETAAIGASDLGLRDAPLTNGFDEFAMFNSTTLAPNDAWSATPMAATLIRRILPFDVASPPFASLQTISELGKGYLRRQQSRSFLLWIHFGRVPSSSSSAGPSNRKNGLRLAIEELLGSARQRRLDENTYVILAETPADSVATAPLIVLGPSVRVAEHPQPIASADIAPTICGLAAISPARSWLGADLTSVIRGEAGAPVESHSLRNSAPTR